MTLRPLLVVALLAATAQADPCGGFTAALGGGTNVGTPFVDTDDDGVTPVLAPFVHAQTH